MYLVILKAVLDDAVNCGISRVLTEWYEFITHEMQP